MKQVYVRCVRRTRPQGSYAAQYIHRTECPSNDMRTPEPPERDGVKKCHLGIFNFTSLPFSSVFRVVHIHSKEESPEIGCEVPEVDP